MPALQRTLSQPDAVRVLGEALWSIAQVALNFSEAPAERDYDDAESGYDNGENVTYWSLGIEALEALGRAGDEKATSELERLRQMEAARDAAAEDDDED